MHFIGLHYVIVIILLRRSGIYHGMVAYTHLLHWLTEHGTSVPKHVVVDVCHKWCFKMHLLDDTLIVRTWTVWITWISQTLFPFRFPSSWPFRLLNITRFVTDISVHSPGFKSRSAYVGFLVDKAILKIGFLRTFVLKFSPVSTIPSTHPVHTSYIHHRRSIISDTDGILK